MSLQKLISGDFPFFFFFFFIFSAHLGFPQVFFFRARLLGQEHTQSGNYFEIRKHRFVFFRFLCAVCFAALLCVPRDVCCTCACTAILNQKLSNTCATQQTKKPAAP
jgi:hypothetical protein